MNRRPRAPQRHWGSLRVPPPRGGRSAWTTDQSPPLHRVATRLPPAPISFTLDARLIDGYCVVISDSKVSDFLPVIGGLVLYLAAMGLAKENREIQRGLTLAYGFLVAVWTVFWLGDDWQIYHLPARWFGYILGAVLLAHACGIIDLWKGGSLDPAADPPQDDESASPL